jgi:hypothetical protein
MKSFFMRFVKDEQGQDLDRIHAAHGVYRPGLGRDLRERGRQRQLDLEIGQQPAVERGRFGQLILCHAQGAGTATTFPAQPGTKPNQEKR